MSNGPDQTPLADQWDRLAGELRACKETQRRTWGDIDNADLGRYLAGEMSSDELAGVESALRDHPELRQLTDLVRDVLGESEPIATSPPPPRTLSFEQARKKRRPVLDFARRRSSLVAAACLLVVLGVAMPQSGFQAETAAPSDLAVEPAVAFRGGPALAMLEQDPAVPAPAPAWVPLSEPAPVAPAPAVLPMSMPPRLPSPPPPSPPPGPRVRSHPTAIRPSTGGVARNAPSGRDGFLPPPPSWTVSAGRVRPPAPRGMTTEQVVAMQREGNDQRKSGNYAGAEATLNRTYSFFKQNYGDAHHATKSSVWQLADVYATGLTSPEAAQAITVRSEPSQGTVTPAANAADDTAKSFAFQLANKSVRQINRHVVPVLTEAIKTVPVVEKRRAYIQALGQIGPAAGPAVAVLTDRLERATEETEAKDVLKALAQMGVAARPALPVLEAYCAWDSKKGGEARARFQSANAAEQQIAAQVARGLKGSDGRVGVRDEAGCFTLAVLCQSAGQIRELARDSGVEVFVETGKPDRAKQKRGLDRMGARAVYVAIDTAGPAVSVKLSEQLQKDGFDGERLRERFLVACQKRDFDRALVEGVKAIQKQASGKKK